MIRWWLLLPTITQLSINVHQQIILIHYQPSTTMSHYSPLPTIQLTITHHSPPLTGPLPTTTHHYPLLPTINHHITGPLPTMNNSPLLPMNDDGPPNVAHHPPRSAWTTPAVFSTEDRPARLRRHCWGACGLRTWQRRHRGDRNPWRFIDIYRDLKRLIEINRDL